MMKTGKEIQGDVMDLLRGSGLAAMVSGAVYRNGFRPRDSKLEDIIVTFTAGFSEQIQTGVVTVNIYVPDIDPWKNGALVEDGARCAEIERAAAEWAENLSAATSNYLFSLNQTIGTYEEPEIKQHFISVKLKYELFE